MAIIEAILAGKRDAKYLASLAHPRVKASKATIAQALKGVWHDQYLFELQQCYDFYQFHQTKIAECDAEIEKGLIELSERYKGQTELNFNDNFIALVGRKCI